MRLIIDGDSFPFINEAVKIAVSRNTEYIIFANKQRRPIKKYEHAWITVPNFYGSADLAILESLRDDDVVVTDDRALAAECADKGATVMRSHGGNFDKKHSTKEYARLRKMSAAERDSVLAVKRRLLTLRLESALDGSGDDAAAERERRSLFAKLNGLYTARLLPGARIRAVTRGLPPVRSFGGSSARDKRFVRARRRRNKAFRRRSAGVFYIRGKRHYGAGKRKTTGRRLLLEGAARALDTAEAQEVLTALEISRIRARREAGRAAREELNRQKFKETEYVRLRTKNPEELDQAERDFISAANDEKIAALESKMLSAELLQEHIKLARELEQLADEKYELIRADKRAAEEAAELEAERFKELTAKARKVEHAARQEADRFKHNAADRRAAAERGDAAAKKLSQRSEARLTEANARAREIEDNPDIYYLPQNLREQHVSSNRRVVKENRRGADELRKRAADMRSSAKYDRSLAGYYDKIYAERLEGVAAAERKRFAAEDNEAAAAKRRLQIAEEYDGKLAAQELVRQRAKQERIKAEHGQIPAPLEVVTHEPERPVIAEPPPAPEPVSAESVAARQALEAENDAENNIETKRERLKRLRLEEQIRQKRAEHIRLAAASSDLDRVAAEGRRAEPAPDWRDKLKSMQDEWFKAPEMKAQVTEPKSQTPETKPQTPEPPPPAEQIPIPEPAEQMPETKAQIPEPDTRIPETAEQAKPDRAKLPKLLRLLYNSVRDIAAAARGK
jgi:uncharacterized protein YaiI (UPF0178 family)